MPNTKNPKTSKNSNQQRTTEKLLRRPKADDSRRAIAGVAVAFADYFGIDIVLVRLLIVLIAFTGPSLLMYLLAWIIIPERD